MTRFEKPHIRKNGGIWWVEFSPEMDLRLRRAALEFCRYIDRKQERSARTVVEDYFEALAIREDRSRMTGYLDHSKLEPNKRY